MRLPKCDLCIHMHDEKIEGEDLTIYCDAFPDGKPWKDIPEDGRAECANGIKYEDENGEYKEFVPEPGSILSKMIHRL